MSLGAWKPRPADDPAGRVLAYHERTKHRRDGWARGPETLDWSSPPRPFRRFEGAPVLPLALSAGDLPRRRWSTLGQADAAPAATLDAVAVGALLELSFALSAWKEHGPDRWALRCNPSSGNLHPTEAYVLSRGLAGLPDALWHYDPEHHALEMRCTLHRQPQATPALWLGLSSIAWREAWKYGERAFRYVQLDLGHALGAVRYAAACLGWSARLDERAGAPELARLLGLDRDADFEGVETEDPEVLIRLGPAADLAEPTAWPQTSSDWQGRAQRLDPHPMYRWPVIDEVAQASAAAALPRRGPGATIRGPLQATGSVASHDGPAGDDTDGPWAVDLIRQRRSAQAYTRRAVLPRAGLAALAQALTVAPLPWDLWAAARSVHALVFVHRVEGLAPGLYALPHADADAAARLRKALSAQAIWDAVPIDDHGIYLQALRLGEFGPTARMLSCTQAIAQDACVAWVFLAEFSSDALTAQPAHYRSLHREAGLMGQALYLQAEALGLRGTGIGCFFDDEDHTMLGLRERHFQAVYHFSVGEALVDARLQSHPPYEAERYRWRPEDDGATRT